MSTTAVLSAQRLEAPDGLALARVADEAPGLGQRKRPQELGADAHCVTFRDAGAAVDAERLLAHDLHGSGRNKRLAPVGGTPGFGLQERIDGSELLPHRRRLDHEVAQDGQIPDRRHGRRPAGGGELGNRSPAGESGAPVDPNRTRAAGSLPAAATEGERAVDVVLDLFETVEQRRLLAHLQLVRLQTRLARDGVEALDLELDAHQ